MGYDYRITNLLPRRTTDPDTMPALPRGMTHPIDAPCPFAHDGFPVSAMGICCSLEGEYLVADLDDHGELETCGGVLRNLDAGQALQLSTTLRQVADRLVAQGLNTPDWAPYAGPLATDAEAGRVNPMLRSMIEGPVVTIRRAADWYEKVAHLGFGVECVR